MDANLIVQRSGHEKVLNVSGGGGGGGGGSGGVGIQLQPSGGGGRPIPPPPRLPPPPPRVFQRPVARPPPPPQPPAASHNAPHNAPHNEEELLDTMDELANPLKKGAGGGGGMAGYAPQHGYDDDEEEDDSEQGEEDEDEEDDGEDQGSEPESGGDDDGEFPPPPGYATGGGGPGMYAPQQPAAERPSEGYNSIEEEKSDIMFKLQRLQRQGVKGMRQFTPYSDIRDMRTELGRIKTELELERSVKFQRKILMAIVSALEWGNSKFNPFDLELDGWSEQMHQSVQSNTEYDGIFEELYFKYRGKVETPPEVRLLLMVGGSAMMFHMTKAMMKSALLPNLGDMMRQNPDMMQNMMRSMGGMAAAAPPPPPAQQQQDMAVGGRREMRGPGLDIGGLAGGLMGGGGGGGGGLGGLMGGLMGGGLPGMGGVSANSLGPAAEMVRPPPPPNPALNPVSTRGTKRQAPEYRPAEESGEDDDSERLSDVVSDDLGSIPDDDLASLRSGDSGDSVGGGRGAKNIRLTVGGRGRGGGGGTKKPRKAPAGTKKVINI